MGDRVSVQEPVQELLTLIEAAELLNVSPTYLNRLLDRGDLPYTTVGGHRRILLVDALAFKRLREAKRREALRDLTRMNQEFGLYERH